MLDLLASIGSIISSLVSFLVNTVNSLVTFITNIPVYLAFLTTSFSLLPSVIIPFALASVTTYIVLLLIDRR